MIPVIKATFLLSPVAEDRSWWSRDSSVMVEGDLEDWVGFVFGWDNGSSLEVVLMLTESTYVSLLIRSVFLTKFRAHRWCDKCLRGW